MSLSPPVPSFYIAQLNFTVVFFKLINFIIFWLCWVFIVASELSLVAVPRLLIAVASLAAERGL